MVSEASYIRMHREDSIMEMIADRPTAIALMNAIALRARAIQGGPYNLKVGEALIGDWKRLGYKTERAYRTDVLRLKNSGWIVTTPTPPGMRRGTIATITESSPFQVAKLVKKKQTEETPEDLQEILESERGKSAVDCKKNDGSTDGASDGLNDGLNETNESGGTYTEQDGCEDLNNQGNLGADGSNGGSNDGSSGGTPTDQPTAERRQTKMKNEKMKNSLSPQKSPQASGHVGPAVSSGDGDRESSRFAEIPSLEEVLEEAKLRMIPESVAREFFDYYDDLNYWVNKNGSPIKWRNRLLKWRVKGQQITNNGKLSGGFPTAEI